MNVKPFLWGAATSAYQIEGGHNQDGRSPSIWDTFCQTQGNVKDGDSGVIAGDHINKFKEDVALMKELGLQSYRFSISWSRIIPACGSINQKGLDFYKRLIEELLQAEITPMATLFHWDLPQWIQDRGGWANKECIQHFLDYAKIMFEALGDRVPLWITHNEPWVYGYLGHMYGDHAPGHKSKSEALQVIHNLLVSHGKVVQLFREREIAGQIGIALNMSSVYSATDTKDQRAALLQDQFVNQWFLNPLVGREYPTDLWGEFSKQNVLPEISEGDMDTISTAIDFLGINYYMPIRVRNSWWGDFGVENAPVQDSAPRTMLGWEIYPQGLSDLLTRIRDEYGNIPVYITENGAAYVDTVSGDHINDQERISYLRGHIDALLEARSKGCGVRGYYVWSFMDNFEWQHGYHPRFGLVYIDYSTQRRIPKASARWYCEFIEKHPNI